MAYLLLYSFLLSCGGALIFFAPACAICPERCDCQHAQHILCANRGLRAVPKAPQVEGLAGDVRVFGLAGNFIHNLSAFDFMCYGNLMRLNLQFNQIRNIHPKTFEKLSKLEELYLGNNLISTIQPGTLQSLKRLTILYSNNNEMNYFISESFSSLNSLVKLRLDGNSIEFLNETVFKGLTNLMFLHLESNRLRHVDRNAFSRLEKLQFLNLSDNKQTELRDIFVFSHLKTLATLLLASNEIRHVGDHVFQNLKKLTKLSLSRNKISKIDREALKGLSRLKDFTIDRNELTEIPAGLLDPLERIEHLDFSDNHISRVDPGAFDHLSHLKTLKLKNNRLTNLSGGVFATNGVLFHVDLNGNNWTCDCRMEKLKIWMTEAHSQGKLLTVFVRCYHPPVLAGTYLDYVNNSQLGNLSGYCESELLSQPMESRGAVVETPVLKEEREKRGEKHKEVGIQEEERKQGHVTLLERKKKRKLGNTRPRATAGHSGNLKKTGNVSSLANSTDSLALTSHSNHNQDVVTHFPIALAHQEQFNLPLQEKAKHHDSRIAVIADACQFNRYSILNVSVEDVTSNTATVRWSTTPDIALIHGKELRLRVLFDRFGHAFRFPRYVYTDGSDKAVTLQELRPDSTYITCVESVVGGALCQVAPRDHCTGFVTLLPSVTSEVNLQLITVAALAVNAVLLLLFGGVWLGRVLKRRIKSRKSSAHAHVRQMYSTRHPFRPNMATTCVSSEFSGYKSGRQLAEEGDLIQFHGDRFFNNSPARRDDDVIMLRYSD
ncbi:TLR4 interactor with leucine rich repeats-like [Myxocyprinus asiaticus]|uniref:TLR4 interactor with leucine rich repeats-like n=1 Tax=Myxocyprinus asiaticus TaxID=70543 RepID=UPI002222CC35|nr:TLR4 interactor with leucine rich repeats-like [Myxocyprinus asiaticus]